MKRLILNIATLLLASAWLASTAWAGVNYIQYHEEYDAREQTPEVSKEGAQEGKHFQHKSRYIQDQGEGQGTVVPASEKSGSGQKYDRPDWVK
jgi:hypothetical protein